MHVYKQSHNNNTSIVLFALKGRCFWHSEDNLNWISCILVCFKPGFHVAVTVANVSPTCREVFVVKSFYACFHMLVTAVTVTNCRKLISYPGIVQAAGGSFKKTNTPPPPQSSLRCRHHRIGYPKEDLCPPWLSQNCWHAVVFLFPLKNNRHDTFFACRSCRRDRTRVYLDDTVVTVVNCCERVATRLFFMFPFGREHYSDDSYNTFATVTTVWKPG
jgi:hypothetical protein